MNHNQKPCDCAFCVRQRAIIDARLRNSLTNIENQLEQSRMKNSEYEKTVKLLRLVDKTPNNANISKLNRYS